MNAAARIPEPSPFARFRAEHAAVRERLGALETWLDAPDTASAASPVPGLVAHLGRQFATHMAAEDAVLFPALALAFPAGRGALAELAADHVELRSTLAVIAELAAATPGTHDDERLRVELRDFIDLLRLHIHREEVAVFDVAARAVAPAELSMLTHRLTAFLDLPRKKGRRT
jgi:hemerythrin-like domain-containing protein